MNNESEFNVPRMNLAPRIRKALQERVQEHYRESHVPMDQNSDERRENYGRSSDSNSYENRGGERK